MRITWLVGFWVDSTPLDSEVALGVQDGWFDRRSCQADRTGGWAKVCLCTHRPEIDVTCIQIIDRGQSRFDWKWIEKYNAVFLCTRFKWNSFLAVAMQINGLNGNDKCTFWFAPQLPLCRRNEKQSPFPSRKPANVTNESIEKWRCLPVKRGKFFCLFSFKLCVVQEINRDSLLNRKHWAKHCSIGTNLNSTHIPRNCWTTTTKMRKRNWLAQEWPPSASSSTAREHGSIGTVSSSISTCWPLSQRATTTTTMNRIIRTKGMYEWTTRRSKARSLLVVHFCANEWARLEVRSCRGHRAAVVVVV